MAIRKKKLISRPVERRINNQILGVKGLSASYLGTFPTSRYPYPDYKPLLDLELIL